MQTLGASGRPTRRWFRRSGASQPPSPAASPTGPGCPHTPDSLPPSSSQAASRRPTMAQRSVSRRGLTRVASLDLCDGERVRFGPSLWTERPCQREGARRPGSPRATRSGATNGHHRRRVSLHRVRLPAGERRLPSTGLEYARQSLSVPLEVRHAAVAVRGSLPSTGVAPLGWRQSPSRDLLCSGARASDGR